MAISCTVRCTAHSAHYYCTASGHPDLQCQDRVELILLVFVWDKSASGTTRSSTEDKLPSCSCPPFIMGQDYLGNSEQPNVGYLNHTVPRDLHNDKFTKILNEWVSNSLINWSLFSSLMTGLITAVIFCSSMYNNDGRSRLARQSILCADPRCPRDSIVLCKSEEHHFCGALLTERTMLAGCTRVLFLVQVICHCYLQYWHGHIGLLILPFL